MRRQAAIVVAGTVALGLGAATAALSTKLETEQTSRRQLVDTALAEQRRAAQAEDLEPPAHAAPDRQLVCVKGVDTFATTAGPSAVLDDAGRLDAKALSRLSRQAARAERRAEVAHAGPGLPQRLGREKTDGAWSSIEPPTQPCKNTTAYAVLETQRPTSTPDGAK